MSDTANQYYDAWVGTMNNHPIKLICVWHVDKAWREKIRDLHVEAEVYKMVRTLLEHTDAISFQEDCVKMNSILRGG